MIEQSLRINVSTSPLPALRSQMTITVQADGLDARDIAVTDGTPANVDFAFAKARLVCFIALADQDVILQTNPTGVGDTINLVKGIPYFWYLGGGINPFNHDVTSVRLTYSGGTIGVAVANVSMQVQADSTP